MLKKILTILFLVCTLTVTTQADLTLDVLHLDRGGSLYYLTSNDDTLFVNNDKLVSSNNALNIENIAVLRTLPGISDNVITKGYYTAGDGGGGTFYWDSESTETDNNGDIIEISSKATGRYKRIIEGGVVDVALFGVTAANTAQSNRERFNAMSTYIYGLEKYSTIKVSQAGLTFDSTLFIHGNSYIQECPNDEEITITTQHIDGIVIGDSLFNNYTMKITGLSVINSYYNARKNSGTGVRLINMQHSKVEIIDVRSFRTSISIEAYDGNSFGYNQVTLGNSRYFKNGLVLKGDGNGWINENLFLGGAFHSTDIYQLPTDTIRLVYFAPNFGEGIRPDNNIFLKLCLEGGDYTNNYMIYLNKGYYNQFIGTRNEDAANTMKIKLPTETGGNTIDFFASYNQVVEFDSVSNVTFKWNGIENAPPIIQTIDYTDLYFEDIGGVTDTYVSGYGKRLKGCFIDQFNVGFPYIEATGTDRPYIVRHTDKDYGQVNNFTGQSILYGELFEVDSIAFGKNETVLTVDFYMPKGEDIFEGRVFAYNEDKVLIESMQPYTVNKILSYIDSLQEGKILKYQQTFDSYTFRFQDTCKYIFIGGYGRLLKNVYKGRNISVYYPETKKIELDNVLDYNIAFEGEEYYIKGDNVTAIPNNYLTILADGDYDFSNILSKTIVGDSSYVRDSEFNTDIGAGNWTGTATGVTIGTTGYVTFTGDGVNAKLLQQHPLWEDNKFAVGDSLTVEYEILENSSTGIFRMNGYSSSTFTGLTTISGTVGKHKLNVRVSGTAANDNLQFIALAGTGTIKLDNVKVYPHYTNGLYARGVSHTDYAEFINETNHNPITTPAAPTFGDIYANRTDSCLYYYNATEWKRLDSNSELPDLSGNGNRIVSADATGTLNTNGSYLKLNNLQFTPFATAPTLSTLGGLYTNTNGNLYFHNGTIWESLNTAGNSTLLSPYASDAPNWLYDVDAVMPPQIDKETNNFDGVVRYTNNTRKNKLVQMMINGDTLPTDTLLTRFIYVESFTDYNNRTGDSLVSDNWEDYQDREVQNSLNLIEQWEFEKAEWDKENEGKPFETKKPKKHIKIKRKKKK